MCKVKNIREGPAPVNKDVSPTVPPWPGPVTNSLHKGSSNDGSPQKGYSCVSTATRDLWDRLFDEGYKADVSINTDDGGIIYAHANILVSLFIQLRLRYVKPLYFLFHLSLRFKV